MNEANASQKIKIKDFFFITEDVICLQEMHIRRKDTEHLIHKTLGEEFYQKVTVNLR